MGIQAVSHREGFVTQSRPFWIEPGYVRKRDVRKPLPDPLRIDVAAADIGGIGRRAKRTRNGRVGMRREGNILVGK